MHRPLSPSHLALGVLASFALVSCMDQPLAPTDSTAPLSSGLPHLRPNVGRVPVARPGGSQLLVPHALRTVAVTTPHSRQLLLENSATGDRALWVISNGAITGSASLGNVPVAWHIVGSGDFNGDGHDDVLWENTGPGGDDGTRAIWFMDGTGRVTSSVSLGIVATTWHIAGAGDYDSDGKDDILWENSTDGSRALWLMNGSTVRSALLIGTLSTDWHMIAAPDLSSDSRADILLEDSKTGNRVLWAMNGAGAVANAVLLGNVPEAWKIVASSDLDGDSRADILLENSVTGARVAWIEDGFGRVTSASLLTTLDPAWHMAALLVPSRGGFAPGISLQATPFLTTGLTAPVFLTQPLNDGRLFVVEQPGRIRVVRNGVLQTTPLLDLSAKLLYSGEQGLLSVAFHPQYVTNHYFYVYFIGLNGEIRIERFTTTANPEVADINSEKLIFTTPHSTYSNHNGGLVSFGLDGMLYAAMGDGGSGGDPLGNGQNFNTYLGGMIRIDVDHGDPYAIPGDNPFVGQAGKKPELWAKGLRNPWRYAFDAQSGLLIIADVGQDLHEEVDAVPATQGGLNYGWNVMEGFSCYNATSCNQTGLTLPILDYPHSPACSITGGYVYRGAAIPVLRGHYFYSDYCAGFLRSVRYQNGVAVDEKDWSITALPQVTSFGRDFAGELYMTSANTIVKIVQGP